jgi:hypothetical protein
MKNEKYFKPDTYVVALKNHVAGIFAFNKGEIAKIINSKSIEYQSTKWAFANGSKYEEEGDIKWFETLEEAQAFSKFLFSPSIPPTIPETKTFDDFGIDPEMEYEATIINSWQGQGTNRWLSGSFCTSEGTWSYHITIFTSNRKLSRLEFKDGIWGLYVNGSANIFIKAEGFIEYYRAELLKMAIQNYPIGTKYSSAFDRTADGECTMTPYWSGDDAINGGSRYIWFKGKWGKILDVPTEKNEEPVDKGWFDKEEWVPEVGDWVKIVSLTDKDGGILNGVMGYIYQIGEINGKWYRCTKETHFIGSAMPIECIVPAEPPNTQSVNAPKEPPVEEEFKIGDIVTITSWHFGKIPLPQKGVIKSISRDLAESYGILISKGSPDINTGTWWFKPGEFVKGFTENTTVEHSNTVEQEEAIPELTHNIKPNSINNNLKSTTAVVGTIKQKSKTIKF